MFKSSRETDALTDCDLLVIGGGAAGLAAAREGVRLGARALLVSDGPIGGDCTFTGCIPSKTLIEHAARGASFTEAMTAARHAIARIAATETPQALAAEGIEVLQGRAAFHGPGQVHVNGRLLRARGYVIATGARPALPPIPGLEEASPNAAYLTHENVFALAEAPTSLAILGGGATGCELAQAFQRLGVQVALVEAADRLLPGEDGDASHVITEVFTREGVTVRTRAHVEAVEQPAGTVRLKLTGEDPIEAQRLLVAVGRTAETTGLGLAEAGIRTDAQGFIATDTHLATTAAGVFAAGDVTGRLQLTHAAYAMGRVAARNALTPRRVGRHRATYTDGGIPRVTFTDPEVAQVGLTQAQARIAQPAARMAYLPMSEVDRAVTANRTDGFIKLIAGPRRLSGWLGGGRVLGATIVAPRAGEMINEITLAMRTGAFTGRLAQTTHAYPTWSIALQQAAAQFFGTYGQRTASGLDGARPSDDGTR